MVIFPRITGLLDCGRPIKYQIPDGGVRIDGGGGHDEQPYRSWWVSYQEFPGNQYSDPEKLTRALKQLAMDLAVPVMVLLKLKEKMELQEDDLLENRFDKVLNVFGNGNLPQYGDLLILILKKIETDDAQDPSAEIHVLKNKKGTTGMVKLKYDLRP